MYSVHRSYILSFVRYHLLQYLLCAQIIGQVVNRTQPVRYTGQYQNFQTGHTYVHPNPQNVCQMIN